MNFLALLAALLAERYFGLWRDDRWPSVLEPLRWWFQPRRPLGAVVLALLPAALVSMLSGMLHGPLLHAAFGGFVLFACLGPRDLTEDIQQLLAARERRDRPAEDDVTDRLRSGPETEPGHESLLGALFIQSHERLFGVLLWFLFAGPAGAVLYRFASRMARDLPPGSDTRDAVETLHAVLAWVPIRATAALFSLAGSMDDAMRTWRHIGDRPSADWRQHSWTVLAEVAAAALDFDTAAGPALPPTLDACLREVARMQNRALLILLAGAALFTGGAWLT